MSVSSAALQRQVARYERILEISQQLTSTLDQATLLRHIVSAATELTDSEAASILLLDEATGELRFEQASNLSATELERIVVPLEGSIAGWVVSHGESRVIQDVNREPRFYKDVDEELEFRTRSLLAVPMKARSKVIGALEAVNKVGDEGFNSEDIRTLTILAGQAAIAIENAKLFQQSDFMSEMVHELRTPLMALKTSSALLLRPDLPPDRREDIVHTMQGETDRLIRLTSEFLDLARLESGRARLDMTNFEVARLIHECIDIIENQAAARGVSVQMEGGDYIVLGDRGKLKQVLLNLLTNAVKYNRDNGSVLVSVYPHRSSEDNPMLTLSVADTGYGISKENQRSMFQKFFRGSDTSGFTAGTGLGLAIAKQIVQGHGGEIWLDSEVGQGSTFYLTMPLVRSTG
jgi:signal transduction histidine kinase